jgi:hypothetical protein
LYRFTGIFADAEMGVIMIFMSGTDYLQKHLVCFKRDFEIALRMMMRLTGELSEMFKRSYELEEAIRQRLGAIEWEI